MRIEQVTAKAFGGLKDATLELAPGLNVVVGPNESGKSTWQAAGFAALCGRRRGKGSELGDREFAARFTPWTGDSWIVGARVVLGDGRTLEVTRDLAGNAARVFDTGLARDVSGEFVFEGSPDLSTVLGFNRRTYPATASVGQAQLLDVITSAGALQHQLQQAAEAAGSADETAAAALALVEKFEQEQVGRDRRGAVKPLRRAKEELELARAELDAARAAHAEYVQRAVEAEQLEEASREAGVASVAAAQLVVLLSQAHERANAVEVAKLAQSSAAAEVARVERDADQLGRRIAEIEQAERALASREPFPELDAARAVGAAALRNQAAQFDQLDSMAEVGETAASDSEVAAAKAELAARDGAVREAREGLAAAQRAQSTPLPQRPAGAGWIGLAVGGVLAVAGVALLVAGYRVAGVAVVAAGVVVGALGMRAGRAGSAPAAGRESAADSATAAVAALELATSARDEAAKALAEAEGRAQFRRSTLTQRESQRSELVAWCLARSLPADAQGLRVLAERVETADQDRNAVRARHSMLLGADDLAALRLRLGELGEELERLRTRAAAAAAEAEQLLEARDAALASAGLAVAAVPGLAERIESARAAESDSRLRAGELSDRASAAAGACRQLASTLPVVADAEERFAAAEQELARVNRLGATLELTRGFLEAAQQHLYRDVAPLLRTRLEPWLPRVTSDRYHRVSIDPADLRLEVATVDGAFRPAGGLSYGTREQIYLLLRVALVDLLTAHGEVSPLLFDDVTVHADDSRKVALLELLHELSVERQVVLFAQDAAVAQWAGERLGPRDRLVELTPLALQ